MAKRIVAEVGAFSKYIYQVGSDEFVVILYDYGRTTDTIANVANDLIHAIAQPLQVHGYDLQISCCIGICIYPECAWMPELLKHAVMPEIMLRKMVIDHYLIIHKK